MFVPWISIVTRVPRCAPVGLTLSSVGGAVWATAAGTPATIATATDQNRRQYVYARAISCMGG